MTESPDGLWVVIRRYYRADDGREQGEVVAEDLYRER